MESRKLVNAEEAFYREARWNQSPHPGVSGRSDARWTSRDCHVSNQRRVIRQLISICLPRRKQGNAGCDLTALKAMMKTFHVVWPDGRNDDLTPYSDGQIFDLLEFSYEHIALPEEGSWHSYWNHSHYSYDVNAGRSKFEQEINRIFERNGIAYSLQGGEVVRIAPAFLDVSLSETLFQTGDSVLR